MRNERLERVFWNKYAGSYDRLAKHYIPYQILVQEVCDHIDNYAQGQPLKILDAGCGTGNYIQELTKRGHQVIGVDSSPAMIKIAENKVKNLPYNNGRPPKILPHDLNQPLPFESQSFDVAISINVVYTLAEYRRFFSELRRVIRPLGVIVVVNSSAPLSLWSAIVAQWRAAKGIKRLSSLLALASVGFWNFLISMRERKKSYNVTTVQDLKNSLIAAGAKQVSVYETYIGSILGVGRF
ncbi:MAG: class I SAM-dependent methyltransferase [Firmicutes bacterium]|nr:class I SAM-dependent methyltransferase [Bacillota bacterium]